MSDEQCCYSYTAQSLAHSFPALCRVGVGLNDVLLGPQWLTGMEPVNYHTLADFRVEQGKELHQLFSGLLGMLSAERLITLEEVMPDGTKIQAQASGKTFRREQTLREHVERARLQVEALRDPLAEPAVNRRQQAARERASREKRERLEQALVELEKLREPKKARRKKNARHARAQVIPRHV